MARILHRAGNRALLLGCHASDSLGQNLPLVIYEALKQFGVGIVDVLDTLHWIALAPRRIVSSLAKTSLHSTLIAVVAASHLYCSVDLKVVVRNIGRPASGVVR